ncbi:hypothetical protein HMPREF3213_01923 [Heyndrickxia coagulans]|uniref:Uncharacterized protein n=1 Tax=Heyndrickxia coagulans TaxID=1398 RepID=A0A133KQ22_HEYCO|nr:hypothetical protein HMPREF3213_01923 [Heyndrickxia coagulans]
MSLNKPIFAFLQPGSRLFFSAAIWAAIFCCAQFDQNMRHFFQLHAIIRLIFRRRP